MVGVMENGLFKLLQNFKFSITLLFAGKEDIKMKEIKIKEFLNTNRLISSKDSSKLKKLLEKEIMQDEKITLNFEGIDIAITRFFHDAIGSLYGKFDFEKVDTSIKFKNLSKPIKFMLNKAISSAKKYYENPEKYKKIDEQAYAML